MQFLFIAIVSMGKTFPPLSLQILLHWWMNENVISAVWFMRYCHISVSMPEGKCGYKGNIPPPLWNCRLNELRDLSCKMFLVLYNVLKSRLIIIDQGTAKKKMVFWNTFYIYMGTQPVYLSASAFLKLKEPLPPANERQSSPSRGKWTIFYWAQLLKSSDVKYVAIKLYY